MISIRLEGGLCNQMTMIAFLLAYSLKHDIEYVVPKYVNNPHIPSKPAYIFPGIKYSDNIPPLPPYQEKHFHYQDIPKMDNVCFLGFWQSLRYFDDYRDEIIKAFGFTWELKKGYCSIHVRRDDYLKWPDHHPPVTEKYLRNAIEYIFSMTKSKVKFIFYSDDLDWCKNFGEKMFVNYPDIAEYSEGKTELQDLQEASCCENNIGSNSIFSLWISYLNQNPDKICTFPRKWFGPLLPHNVDDLYPPYATIV